MPPVTSQTRGRRPLDTMQRAGLAEWARTARDRINELRRVRSADAARLAEEIGVSRTTLLGWLAGEATPDPWVLARLGSEIRYPLDEQLSALGWRPSQGTSDPPGGLSRAAHDITRFSERIARVAMRLESTEQPTISAQWADCIARVGEGRWQVATRPYQDGVEHRRTRETLVEFGLVDGAEPLEWDELGEQYESYLTHHASPLYVPSDNRRWDQICRERLELLAILHQASATTVDGTFMGETGERWRSVSVLRRSTGGKPWTHLFAYFEPEPPGDLPDPAAPQVLVIGPTFQTATVVSRLLGERHGWRVESNEWATSTRYGRPRREHLDELRAGQLADELVEWIAKPAGGVIRSVVRLDTALNAQVQAALAASPWIKVAAVLPTHPVADAWLDQQLDNTVGEPRLAGVEEMVRRSTELRGALATCSRAVCFELNVAVPRKVSATNFRDPQIFDAQFEVATKVSAWLDAGCAVSAQGD